MLRQALDAFADGHAADGGAHHVVHVRDVEAVAGGGLAVDVDVQGITQLLQDRIDRLPLMAVRLGDYENMDPTQPGYFSSLGCAHQLDTNVMSYIERLDNRRVFAADPVTGLVMGLSHFRHKMDFDAIEIRNVPGVTERPMDYDSFDLPAAHIYKIGPDGKIHEIEAMGFTAPYMAPTGWE